MITANVIHRVFHIRWGTAEGTCFAIDHDGRQYIVTARHVIENFPTHGTIQIYHQDRWNELPASLVGVGAGAADVGVLALSQQIAPALPLPATGDGSVYGQDVYFLGFPLGLRVDIGDLNRQFPLPLVRKGVLSSLGHKEAGVPLLLIDGHNLPGLSGGPVVFSAPGAPANKLNVAGVISGYRFKWDAVYLGGQETSLVVQYNTGIVIATEISVATALIDANPIGPVVSG